MRVTFTERGRTDNAFYALFGMVGPGSPGTHDVSIASADVSYDPGHPVVLNNVETVLFHVAANNVQPTPFNFCVSDVEVLGTLN